MLANLFLPKEIRDIIAELRSKDDLNEKFFTTINKDIIFTFLVLVTFFTIIIASLGIWKFYTIAFMFIIVALKIHTHNISYKYIIPFSLGIPTRGTITSSIYESWYKSTKGYWIEYKFKHHGQTYFGKYGPLKRPLPHLDFSQGQNITIYVNENKPNIHAPYVEKWQENYRVQNRKLAVIN